MIGLAMGLSLRPRSDAPPGTPAEAAAAYKRQEAVFARQAAAEPVTGRLNLNFAKLNFYLPPETKHPTTNSSGYEAFLPSGIKTYDGRDVRIQGYMLPTRLENGLVRECVVLPNQMSCCFGQVPRFCQFIVARMGGAGVPNLMDRPIVFQGKLHVGDVFTNGYWTALYTIDAASAEN
jgi:hypothetical protein